MSYDTLFSTELGSLCKQTITHRPKNTMNNYGEAQYTGSTTSYSAYVRRVTAAEGLYLIRSMQVEWKAYIPSTTLTVGIDDEVILPTGVTAPIAQVHYAFDEYGQQAVILTIGKHPSA